MKSVSEISLFVKAYFLIFLSVTTFASDSSKSENFPFTISTPWNAQTMSRVYNYGRPIKLKTFDSAMNYILYKSKLNFMADDLVDSGSKKEEVEDIANRCAKYANTWQVSRCVSDHVHSFLAKTNWINGYRPNTNVSFCRAHAHTFKQVMEYLNRPEITVEFQDANFVTAEGQLFQHVVNQIRVTSNDTKYSYILDVGWHPDILYPVNNL